MTASPALSPTSRPSPSSPGGEEEEKKFLKARITILGRGVSCYCTKEHLQILMTFLFLKRNLVFVFDCVIIKSPFWLAAQRVVLVKFSLRHLSILGLFPREHFSHKELSPEQIGVL